MGVSGSAFVIAETSAGTDQWSGVTPLLTVGLGADATGGGSGPTQGYVGIGTTDPSQKLDINGNIRVANNGNVYCNGSGELYLGNTNGGVIRVGGDGGTSTALGSFNHLSLQTSRDEDDIYVKTGASTTTRLFVEGDTGNIGIGTTTPKCALSIAGSLALNVTGINAANDPGATYTMAVVDCVILVNTRPTAEGGIDSALTLVLPDASDYPGRVITVKDAAGYADVNAITIKRAGSDTINGVDVAVSLPAPASFKTFISDGNTSWQEIGN